MPQWPAPENIVAMTTLRGTDLNSIDDLPATVCHLKQVHGVAIAQANYPYNEPPNADASFTSSPNTVCVVRTADCLPILICDRQGTQVAAIHAGWRGLAAGIVAKTCQKLTVAPQHCLAWLGPAIGASSFEVGQDVLEGFLEHSWAPEHVATAFRAKSDAPDKWFGDLYYLARKTLQQHGFLADNIYGGEWCTYSDPDRFYSYRRSKDVGRMSSLIWIKS